MAEKEKTANERKLEELEAQHGSLASFEAGGQLYAFKAIDQDEYESFQGRLRKAAIGDGVLGPINRELAQAALVHPELEKLQALMSRYPAVAGKISDAIAQLAGSDIEISVKKG